jgi:hypothetical protein
VIERQVSGLLLATTGDARDKEAVLRWAQEAPGTDAEQAREFFIAMFEFNYNRKNSGDTRFKLFIISVRSAFKARNCWFFTSNCCYAADLVFAFLLHMLAVYY